MQLDGLESRVCGSEPRTMGTKFFLSQNTTISRVPLLLIFYLMEILLFFKQRIRMQQYNYIEAQHGTTEIILKNHKRVFNFQNGIKKKYNVQ